MTKTTNKVEEVEVAAPAPVKKEVKPYMPLSELIGQKSNEIFGVKLDTLDQEEKKRLERGLMTDKVYQLTLPNGNEIAGKIQLSKNFKEEGGVVAAYKPQYEKAYIPQKTFDGYQFSMPEQNKLREGENVMYKTKLKNGTELTKLAKVDLPKNDKDQHYTNQLIVADITRLPIDKITYGQKLNTTQLVDFLSGRGVEIKDPKLGENQHKGNMILYFDPIKGGTRYKADEQLLESFKVSQFQRDQKNQTQVTKQTTKLEAGTHNEVKEKVTKQAKPKL